MMRPSRLVALLASALVLAACTPDTPDGDTPARQSWTRAQLEAAVFARTEAKNATTQIPGAVPDRVSPIPAWLTISEVVAHPATTVVRFTLRGTGGGSAQVGLDAFNAARPLTDDIRDIALVDVAGNRRLRPFVGVSADDASVSLCSCADSPPSVGPRDRALSGVFPALKAGTTTVTVQVPGFPPVTRVPVRQAR